MHVLDVEKDTFALKTTGLDLQPILEQKGVKLCSLGDIGRQCAIRSWEDCDCPLRAEGCRRVVSAH